MTRRVLVIEDSDEDYDALLRALDRAGADVTISRRRNGDDALETLRAQAQAGQSRELPEVVLLDLNLPGTDGRDILDELKNDEVLKLIPIVVLSTSTNPQDVADCYRRGVNGYCCKAGDRARFAATISSITSFWFQAALVPNHLGSR